MRLSVSAMLLFVNVSSNLLLLSRNNWLFCVWYVCFFLSCLSPFLLYLVLSFPSFQFVILLSNWIYFGWRSCRSEQCVRITMWMYFFFSFCCTPVSVHVSQNEQTICALFSAINERKRVKQKKFIKKNTKKNYLLCVFIFQQVFGITRVLESEMKEKKIDRKTWKTTIWWISIAYITHFFFTHFVDNLFGRRLPIFIDV